MKGAPALGPALDAVFAALADPIRRAIVERLSAGVCALTDLSAPFDVSAPAISKHLRVLEAAGLIRRAKQGRLTYCRLTTSRLEQARQWWETHHRFWGQQLDSLEHFLEEEGPRWQRPRPQLPPTTIRVRTFETCEQARQRRGGPGRPYPAMA